MKRRWQRSGTWCWRDGPARQAGERHNPAPAGCSVAGLLEPILHGGATRVTQWRRALRDCRAMDCTLADRHNGDQHPSVEGEELETTAMSAIILQGAIVTKVKSDRLVAGLVQMQAYLMTCDGRPCWSQAIPIRQC